MDQMYVDGVVYKAVKAGASSNPPGLRMATPLGEPLMSSSNFDCSQVRVPSAKTKSGRTIEKMTNSQRKRIKLKSSNENVGRKIQVITARATGGCAIPGLGWGGHSCPASHNNGGFLYVWTLRSTSNAADKNVRSTRIT